MHTEQSFTKLRDSVYMGLIRLLRIIPLYAPFDRGLWRIETLIIELARRLQEDWILLAASRDGRRFRVRLREPTYYMGLLGRGIYEPVETTLVQERLTSGSIAVDIGANFGWYTTIFSRLVGPRGMVHAFEPVPNIFEELQTNCQLNNCTNVLLNNCALGDRSGTTVVHEFPGEPSGHSSLFGRPDTLSLTTGCHIRTLDDYMAQHGQPCHFIKIDVEGAEAMVLKGGQETIREYLPIILLELNANTLALAGHTASDVLAILQNQGYRIFQIGAQTPDLVEIREPFASLRLPLCINVLCLPERRCP